MTVAGRRVGIACVTVLVAGCAGVARTTVTPPAAIWLKRGRDEVEAHHDNLDDLRVAPGGTPITDWRVQSFVSYPPDHVPGGFLARHVGHPEVPEQWFTASGESAEHDGVVWFRYRPR